MYISQKSYFANYFIEPLAVARRVVLNRVCPSFRQSFHLSWYFLGIVSLIFSKFWHGGRILCEVVHGRSRFSGKIFFTTRIGRMGPKWAKNLVILLSLIYNENLYYLLCSCTNPIFEKIFVPEIWAKMFSAIQIAGLFNLPYLQNKSMK